MVETCSLTLYNINKTVMLTCRSINYLSIVTWMIKDKALKWGFCRTCLIKSNSKRTKRTESFVVNIFIIAFTLLQFKCQTKEKKRIV